MLSLDDKSTLLDLCNKFQHSGDDITLAHLLDALSSTTLDQSSQEYKDWSKYMEKLNETWVLINKENEQVEWPTPPSTEKTAAQSFTTPVNLFENLPNTGQSQRESLRLELKMRLDGGQGVGPARQSSKSERTNHRAGVQLSKITSSPSLSTPSVYSAPSLLDLVNSDNIEPQDGEAMEEFWFNNPDPYSLNEMDQSDPTPQETIVRSSTRFDISSYVKLNDGKLVTLISNVDKVGPGAAAEVLGSLPSSSPQTPAGKPGEWNVESFF